MRFQDETGIPGTYFVCPTKFGTKNYYMDLSDAKRLLDKGNELAYHGWNHYEFTTHKTEAAMVEDIEKSLDWFNRELGIRPVTVAHPSHCLAWIEVLRRYFPLIRDDYAVNPDWKIPEEKIPEEQRGLAVALDGPESKEYLPDYGDKARIFKLHDISDTDIKVALEYKSEQIMLFRNLWTKPKS